MTWVVVLDEEIIQIKDDSGFLLTNDKMRSKNSNVYRKITKREIDIL